jgi:hypothetical protein
MVSLRRSWLTLRQRLEHGALVDVSIGRGVMVLHGEWSWLTLSKALSSLWRAGYVFVFVWNRFCCRLLSFERESGSLCRDFSQGEGLWREEKTRKRLSAMNLFMVRPQSPPTNHQKQWTLLDRISLGSEDGASMTRQASWRSEEAAVRPSSLTTSLCLVHDSSCI